MHRLAHAIGLLLLVPFAASALELGEASITSGLGQSLRVAVPYRLASDEQIVAACVGLAGRRGTDDLPTYANVTRISVTPTEIQIFDDRPVVEPLIGLNVEVHCPRTPHVMRNYQLLVDLPERMPATAASGPAVAVSSAPTALDAARAITNDAPPATAIAAPPADAPTARAVRATTSARARGLNGGTLPQGQTYRVVRGDTLSGIAARIAERPGSIGETADAIFAANPAAFTRGNPDLIEEGRSITIPNLSPAAIALAVPAAAPSTASAREPVQPASAQTTTATAEPAPSSATASSAVDAASVATEPLAPVPTTVHVTSPATDEVSTAPARVEVAHEAPSRIGTGGISSGLLAALLAVAAIVLSSAAVVIVRRRRPQETAAQIHPKSREPARRKPIDLARGIDVVESLLPSSQAAAIRGANPSAAADTGAVSQDDLKDLALDTASLDFDVGAAIAANEGVDAFATAAPSGHEAAAESATVRMVPDPATEPTIHQQRPATEPARSPEPIDDEKHTLTIVELDMLRQDYEAEHTLTQQGNQELREALADLATTKAARAATAETATLESPQVEGATDSTIDAPTARLRSK